VEFDEGGDEAFEPTEFGRPLPPEDRLWRHPSEMGAAARSEDADPSSDPPAAPAPAPAPARRRAHAAALLAGAVGGVAGAALTVGALGLFGAFEGRVVQQVIAQEVGEPFTSPIALARATAPTPARDVASLAQRNQQALALVEVTSPLGTAIGTAVAFRPDGFYVTSRHLLEGGGEAFLTASDGKRRAAEVVADDPWTNITVLRVPGVTAMPPSWGSTAALKAGSDIVVIGAAPDATHLPSVARGVVNTQARATLDNGMTLHDLLRTDANVLPGGRGALMVDGASGAVIGILTTIGRDEAGVARIGYATKIELVRSSVETIARTGRPTDAWLGIEGDSLSDDRARSLGVAGGVDVRTVTPGSPADVNGNGLRAGDVIVAVDGAPVLGMSPLHMRLREIGPGNYATVTYLRDAGPHQLLVVLANWPKEAWPPGAR
jgi:S1-C subfamily serine protease